VGEDVVAGHQVGPPVPGGDLPARLGPEELHFRRDAAGPGGLGHVRGGLDALHRYPAGLEMLQQVAVVARHLGDQAVRREAEAADHRVGVSLCVRYPGVRIRREVGIVGKDMFARYICGDLDKKAVRAQAHV
jgi:hypothetical protein